MDSARSQHNPHILLVEDEALIAMHERTELERAGYRVTYAKNGEAAIEHVDAAGQDINLILMDIDLGPGIDGTEAAGIILARYSIPVVFLTAHTEPEYVERTERISSYGYVVKNSGTMVLLRSIEMALRLHEAHREVERSRWRYEQLFRNMTSGMLLIEGVYENGELSDYRFVDANPAVELHSGIPADAMKGRTQSELFPEMSVKWLDICRSVLTSGETVHYRQYSRTLGRTLNLVAFPYDEGRFAVEFVDVSNGERGFS